MGRFSPRIGLFFACVRGSLFSEKQCAYTRAALPGPRKAVIGGGLRMTGAVEVPVWLLVVIAALALWVIAERLFLPGVRWFFRRRVNMVIERFNQRLKLRLPTFSLTRRKVLVDRLTYDPQVLTEVRRYCDETDTPWDVALARVEGYAREIVPSLNAYIYERVASLIVKRLIRRFYRVRLTAVERLETLDENASIVFVINHRSNMDYLLVAYLAMRHTLLSYAVGEWARVWPLQQLIQALGGYFVRRNSGDELYRRVLERYVQMAVEGGVVQAMFPEGGLSRDGAFREPRIGLFDYIVRGFDVDGSRDVLFIPVGVNYDWVLEDRKLLAEAGHKRLERRSTLFALVGAVRYLGRRLRRRFRGEWYRMGYAAAVFGEPVSLRAWCTEQGIAPDKLPREERIAHTQAFAGHLLEHIGNVVPALPVPLLSWIMLGAARERWTREQLESAYMGVVAEIDASGRGYVPRREPTYAVELALRILKSRQMVREEDGCYRVEPLHRAIMRYYANTLRHLLGKPRQLETDQLPERPRRRRNQRSTKARSIT